MIPRNDEIKAAARTSLSGHYTPIVMAFLTAEMILWLFGTFLSGPSRTAFGRLTSMVLSFVISVILLVIDAGFHYMYLQLARHRQIRITDMFRCFRWQSDTSIKLAFLLSLLNLGASFPFLLLSLLAPALYSGVAMNILLFLLQVCVLAVINIIYSMSFFILVDMPDLSPVQIMKKSRNLTRGYRLRLAGLTISMVGYVLLGIISLGIGLLWVCPYVGTILAHFYLSCADREKTEAADF